MTNQTKFNATLNDEQIVEVAKKIDAFIMSIGEEYSPTGIEFAAIALGRLMIFAKHTECLPIFKQMLTEVSNMNEPDFLSKTEDVKQV